MTRFRLFNWLRSKGSFFKKRNILPFRFHPSIELLEKRETPATFTVTNTNDNFFGSLRQAITDLNLSTDPTNEIHFAITGAGPTFTISPLTALPNISKPVNISGYISQPGSAKNTLSVDAGNNATIKVVLDGQAGAGTGLFFVPGSQGSLVEGLSFVNFSTGVAIATDGIRVAGNYFGVFPDGSFQTKTAITGVSIGGSSAVIGDHSFSSNAGNQNLFAKFTTSGISISSTLEANILENRIGLGRDNNANGGNQLGILLNDGNTANAIISDVTIQRNLIGRNDTGISILTIHPTATISDIKIGSNFIGTDGANSTTNLGNTNSGIFVGGNTTNVNIGGDPQITPGPDINTIAFNNIGVLLNSPAQKVLIGINTIRNNTNGGIQVQPGANPGAISPILTQQAEPTAGNFTFNASITGGAANTTYTIQFYSTLITDSRSQGANFLGATTITTNGSGTGTLTNFAPTFNTGLIGPTFVVTATLSNANIGTSAFSAGPPAVLILQSGQAQNALINQPFPAPLVVKVQDSRGDPVTGLGITFTAPATGASAFIGQNNSTTVTAGNSTAVSSPVVTANSTSGAFTATASIGGNTVLSPLNFNLTNYLTPSVVSINRASGTTVSTSADFNVTFSETVFGVDPGDFAVIKTGTVNNGGVTVTGTGKNYTVTVAGITGNGSLGLNLVDNGSIRSPAGTPLYPANATASFLNQATFAVGTGPRSVTLGDVNGDGKLDLVTANFTSNNASVLLGTSNGSFGAQATFAVGTSPYSVASGDVNGDGKLDLVTVNLNSDNASVLFGDGNGNFATQVKLAVGDAPASVALGDLNGDGSLDIVAANRDSDNASVLLNNGTGSFATQTTFAVGDGPRTLTLGDVNGDGKLDIVTANSPIAGATYASVLLGNGNGTFATQTTFGVGPSPESVTLGDVNSDGKLDMVIANGGGNTASVLLGNGNGTFQAQSFFAIGTSPRSLILGDFNGDGKLDLVTANAGSNNVSVLLGNGNGVFQTQTTFAAGTNPFSVTMGDFNGDGRLDLATANIGANSTSVLLNALNDNFTGQTYTVAQPAAKLATGTTVAGAASGSPFTIQPIIIIQDAGGETVTTSTASVTIAVSGADGKASLLGTTSVNAVNGKATFSGVGINGTAGQTYTLTFTSTGLTNTTQNITATFGTATHVSLVANAAGAASGLPFTTQPVLAIRDSFGNIVTSNNAPVSMTVSGGDNKATLIGTTIINAVNGVATFSGVGINGTSGQTYTLTFSSTGLTAATQNIPAFGYPNVVSINRVSGTTVSTSADFIVSFSETVVGVDPSDFAVIKTGTVNNGTITVIGTGSNYAVTVPNITGNGSLGLNLVDNGSIRSPAGTPLYPANAAASFATLSTNSAGTGTYSLAMADVNGDGKQDIVTANFNSNNVSVLLGNGDGTFQTATNFATATGPISVSIGDINNDAKLDIVTANVTSNNVSVLFGTGDGKFPTPSNFIVANNPRSVALGDFNGDGRLDIATANGASDNVSVLLSTGNGNFNTAVNFGAGDLPNSIALGDLNGDGRLDIATANSNSDNASVLLGTGNGNFNTAVNFGAGDLPFSVTLGDVNSDGKIDIVTANKLSDNVSVLIGNGDATFKSAAAFGAGDGASAVTLGDVNGDGKIDIATANYLASNSTVLLGNGNGTFQTANSFAAGNRPYSIALGDLNGDGRLDLATGGRLPDQVGIRLNALNGNFTGQTYTVENATKLAFATSAAGAAIGATFAVQPGITIQTDAGATVTTSTAAVTMTVGGGDNKATLIGTTTVSAVNGVATFSGVGINGTAGQNYTLTFSSNGLAPATQNITAFGYPNVVSINRASGTSVSTSAVFNVTFSESVVGVAPIDFAVIKTGTVNNGTITLTGTGKNYTVTVPGITGNGSLGLNLVDNGSIRSPANTPLYPANAAASFLNQTTFGPFDSKVESVVLGDLNGDGKLDIVTANFDTTSVGVLLGNGNGSFGVPATFAVGTYPDSVVLGDVNGDGKLDIATANSFSGNASVLLGNGNGTFATQQTFATGIGPFAVTLGDVNRDGKLDLVTANNGSNNSSVLLGNGNGTFAVQSTFAVGGLPFSVSLGDFNGDGNLDLVTANNDDTTSVLLGDGKGGFAPQTTFKVGDSPLSVTLGDVNADGKLDIVTMNFDSANASVLLGNGNGTFANQVTFGLGIGPRSGTLGDVNGDGKLDIVTANSESNNASVLLGNGNGTFAAQTTFSVGTNPLALVMGDVNGDGRLDIGTANYGSANASVLLNALNGNFTGQTYSVVNATKLTIATAAAGAAIGATFAVQPVISIQNAAGDPISTSTAGVTMTVSGGDNKATLFGTTIIKAVNGVATFSGVGINGTAGQNYLLTFTSGALTPATQNITAFGYPNVVSINRVSDTTVSTSADFIVTFSEPVVGVDAADFVVINTGTVNIGTVSITGKDTNYTVTVPGITGNGTLGLKLVDNGSIKSPAGTPLYPANASASFLPQATFPVGTGPTSVSVGDVNLDGKLDLVTANFFTDNASVLLGNGNGSFATQTTFAVGNGPESVILGDFNSDAFLDIVTGNNGGNNVSVLFGVGNGTFAVGNRPRWVTLGDVNGDGNLDIVTANFDSDTASVLLGNGIGSLFAAQTTFAVGDGPLAVALGDVNGDGKLDMVTGNQYTNNTSVLLGNGNGSFAAQTTFAVGDGSFSVSLGDVNGDGKLDIVAPNDGDDTVSVLLGNGNGTFANQATFAVGNGPFSVSLGDVNGDGKLDLVAANYFGANGSVLLGNGNGTFATQTTFELGTNPRSVTFGDVNGDNRLDIVNANFGSSNTSVLLNGLNGNFTGQFYTVAQPAAKLAFAIVAAGAASGAAFTTQPVITIQDSAGETVTTSTAAVTIAVSGADGKASIFGATTISAVNGKATFSTVGINGTAGQNYTLTFSSTGLTAATQTIIPTIGNATNLAITKAAFGAVNGQPFTQQPTIAIKDSGGNTVTSSTASVSVKISGGDDKGVLFGTTTVTAANGLAQFSGTGISGTTKQTYTLNFTSSGLFGSAQSVTLGIASTTTEFVSSPNPSVFGEPISLTAVVTSNGGIPSGKVTFKNGTIDLGSANLDTNGAAVLSISPLQTGTTSITAVYEGNDSFLTSTSAPVNQVVKQAATSTGLTSSTDPSVLGESVSFTAEVLAIEPGAGIPSGTVTFFNGTRNLGTSTLNIGFAALAISNLPLGTSSIKAVYNGNASFLSSSSDPLPQTVSPFGAAVKLTLTTNAGAGGNGLPFPVQPVVAIQDSFSNTVANSSLPVLLSVSGGDGRASLVGNPTVNAVNGIAAFSGVGITGTAGQRYLLTYSNDMLIPATQDIVIQASGPIVLTSAATSITFASGLAESKTLAFFSGPKGVPASAYSAIINWGDNTPNSRGSIVPPATTGGAFVVNGTHLYTRPANYTLSVTVSSTAGSPDASISTTAVVLTPNQLNNLNASQLSSLPPNQIGTKASVANLKIIYVQPPTNPNTVDFFVASFNTNPQSTQPTLPPESFFDIRVVNPSLEGKLSISLPFNTDIGQGSPFVQFSQNKDLDTSASYNNVLSSNQLVIINYVTNTITVILDQTSLPRLNNLSGTVFTVVNSPATVSPNTVTIVPGSFSPNLVTMILPSGLSGTETLSTPTSLTFQTTVTSSLTLAPLQSSTRALVLSSNYGGTNANPPDAQAMTWQDYLKTIVRGTLGKLPEVVGQTLLKIFQAEEMPLLNWWNQLMGIPPKAPMGVNNPQEEEVKDPPAPEALLDPVFEELELQWTKPELLVPMADPTADKITAPAGVSGFSVDGNPVTMGAAAFCASYLLEAYRKKTDIKPVGKQKRAKT